MPNPDTPGNMQMGSPPPAESSGTLSPSSPTTKATISGNLPGAAPQLSLWEQLRHSRTVWGYIYRLGAPPVVTRTTRDIYANDPAANEGERFVDNIVVTSRYTWYNFVPLFLFQQFSRFANFYFLIVCILQAIPEISITNGIPSSALPLAFVLFFDGIVTAREDYVRHRDDAHANARKVLALRKGRFEPVEWRNVKVGDIVKVRKGEEFPADLLFLASEHEDPEQRGVCHVQTAQLDGETNLKIRNAHEKTVPLFRHEEDCAQFRGRLHCEEPHENFAKFNGTLYLERDAKKGVPMDANATLLRGCVLKNVDAAYGLVIYTGRETKVRVKQSAVISKKASVEAEINRYIIALILLQLVLCIAGAVGYYVWGTQYGVDSWYLDLSAAPTGTETVARFFTFFLLISNIIPISLYVTMKLARTAQKFFMDSDINVVYIDEELLEKSGGEEGVYPLKVRSMDLNDELGQISHIFSDKTGTLTSNYMEFRKLTVNGVIYGRGTTEIGMARRRRLQQDVTELQHLMDENAKKKREVPHVNFIEGSESHPGRTLRGPESDLNGSGAKRDPAQAEALRLFFLNMCLNHTVVIEHVEDRVTKKPKSQLSASSPDEEAFVLAAKYFGIEFKGRQKDTITLNMFGHDCYFRVLVVIAYSSARQMMSVVVEDMQATDPNKKYILLCKGSDTRMLKLNVLETGPSTVSKEVLDQQLSLINATKQQLVDMAEDGLRTLAFAFRFVPESELLPWLERYEGYLGDINEKRLRDAKLPNKIDETANEMETRLLFQGATANEDKLQEEVPETIALLAEAGIKIYMLTGDKQETAINIGYAARMLTNEFVRILITSEELFGDKLQEEVARRRNADFEQKAAAAGISVGELKLQLAYELPQIPTPILEINTRVKLRKYANISRAKAKKTQDFSRARGLVVDEPVMNLVWPSITKLGKVTPYTVKDVYKDVASVVAKARALSGCLKDQLYEDYEDTQWAEAEGEALAGMSGQELVDDTKLQKDINAVLTEAGLPNLLGEEGMSSLNEKLLRILKLQQAIHQSNAADGADSRQAELSAMLTDLNSDLERVFACAKKVMVLHGKNMQEDLLIIAESCRSVICCRCRPDQKKKMLELIRYHVKTSRCLAVGDGANDVDMIQAANVGVGIIGPEGVQAANASDYAIGRFKFLSRLLLVHGRWNYNRMAFLVCYMFYKNVLYAFCQMLYTVVAAWSGQKFYVEIASQTFNLVYTGVPILLVGMFDKDVSATNAARFPYLYSDGLLRRRLNIGVLLWWLATAIYEATLLFVFSYFGSHYNSNLGSTPYVFEFGTWVFTALVVIVNVRLAMNATTHSWLLILFIIISLGIWWPAAYIMDAVDADGMNGGMQFLFSNGGFWLWLLLIVVASQLHVFSIAAIRRYFTPEYRDLVQEYEILTTPTGSKPTSYQKCCTCGMRRRSTPQRRTPQQLLTILDAKTHVNASNVNADADGQKYATLLAEGHNLQHFDARLSEALIKALEVDFGPDLNNLADVGHPTARCKHRPDWRDLPVAEDIAEELIEWPVSERMKTSLMMKRNQLLDEATHAPVKSMEHPEVSLRRVKIEMLRARFSALVEHGLTSDADDLQPTVVRVEEPTPPTHPEEVTAGVPALPPAVAEWRKIRDATRFAGYGHDRKRSVTDFSVDDRSSTFYGDAFSTVGRRIISTRRVGGHGPTRSEAQVHVSGLDSAAGTGVHPRSYSTGFLLQGVPEVDSPPAGADHDIVPGTEADV